MLRLLFISLLFSSLIGCTTSIQSTQSKPYLKKGSDCTQTQIEARWLAQLISDRQKWYYTGNKRFTSALEHMISEVRGELRYNAMFLQTNPEDLNAWSFYTPTRTSTSHHQNNLFLSIAQEDNTLLQINRHVWIDSRYRTLEFTEKDLVKICPDCVASKDRYKVAIVSKFPNGRIDLWILEPNGVLNNTINGCE